MMRDENIDRNDEAAKVIRLFLRLLARLAPQGRCAARR